MRTGDCFWVRRSSGYHPPAPNGSPPPLPRKYADSLNPVKPVTEFKKGIPRVFNKVVRSTIDIRKCAAMLIAVKQSTDNSSGQRSTRRQVDRGRTKTPQNLKLSAKYCLWKNSTFKYKDLRECVKFSAWCLEANVNVHCDPKAKEVAARGPLCLNSQNAG